MGADKLAPHLLAGRLFGLGPNTQAGEQVCLPNMNHLVQAGFSAPVTFKIAQDRTRSHKIIQNHTKSNLGDGSATPTRFELVRPTKPNSKSVTHTREDSFEARSRQKLTQIADSFEARPSFGCISDALRVSQF